MLWTFLQSFSFVPYSFWGVDFLVFFLQTEPFGFHDNHLHNKYTVYVVKDHSTNIPGVSICRIFAKFCELTFEPEDHWSCIAHLSAEDMLKSVGIEKKKFKHRPLGRDRQPIRAKILMSTGRPHHYGHLLQV